VAAAFGDAGVLHMDDFYLSCDDDRVPRRHGRIDWESRDSVDLVGLHEAVERLLKGEPAEVPHYDMEQSRRQGTKVVSAAVSGIVLVEGLFAFDVFPTTPCHVTRVLLRTKPLVLLWRRVRSDVREKRRALYHAITHALRLSCTDRNFNANEQQYADIDVSSSLPPDRIAGRIMAMWPDKGRASRACVVPEQNGLT
jgi:uridine kinase